MRFETAKTITRLNYQRAKATSDQLRMTYWENVGAKLIQGLAFDIATNRVSADFERRGEISRNDITTAGGEMQFWRL